MKRIINQSPVTQNEVIETKLLSDSCAAIYTNIRYTAEEEEEERKMVGTKMLAGVDPIRFRVQNIDNMCPRIEPVAYILSAWYEPNNGGKCCDDRRQQFNSHTQTHTQNSGHTINGQQ